MVELTHLLKCSRSLTVCPAKPNPSRVYLIHMYLTLYRCDQDSVIVTNKEHADSSKIFGNL